jgi:hypothetical protein
MFQSLGDQDLIAQGRFDCRYLGAGVGHEASLESQWLIHR